MDDSDSSSVRDEYNDHDKFTPTLKRNRPDSSLSSKSNSKGGVNKDSEEYLRKRARNNLAVKKSRDRSKKRILETQKRVEQLTKENKDLQTRVSLLIKELNVLRALFTNGGFTVPCNLQIVAAPRGGDLNCEKPYSSESNRVTSSTDLDTSSVCSNVTKPVNSPPITMMQDKQNYTSVIRSTRPSPRLTGPDLLINVTNENGDTITIKQE